MSTFFRFFCRFAHVIAVSSVGCLINMVSMKDVASLKAQANARGGEWTFCFRTLPALFLAIELHLWRIRLQGVILVLICRLRGCASGTPVVLRTRCISIVKDRRSFRFLTWDVSQWIPEGCCELKSVSQCSRRSVGIFCEDTARAFLANGLHSR